MVVSALYNNGLSGLGGNVFYHTNTTSTSSSSSKKYNSVEELEEARRKYNEKYLTQQADAIATKHENDIALKEAKKTIEILKENKQEDGSVTIDPKIDEFKKMPWWKKGLRAIAGIGQGVINFGAKLVGYKDGKWDLKSCITNLAVAAAGVAACAIPVVGPFIGGALLATGIYSGGRAIYKGFEQAKNAENVQEWDAAFQSIGEGATTLGLSVAGVRSFGKLAPNRITFAASKATQRTSAIGKQLMKVSQAGNNAWANTKQICADMTVNAVKGMVNKSSTQLNALKAANKNAGFWDKAGGNFFKQWGKNITEMFPAMGNKKFQQAKDNATRQLNEKIQKIEKIPEAKRTNIEQIEHKILTNYKNKLENCKTNQAWKDLRSEIDKDITTLRQAISDLKSSNTATIDGKQLNPNVASRIQKLEKYARSLNNQAKTLSNLQASAMRTMALRPKKNASEINTYTGSTHSTTLGHLYGIGKTRTTVGSALISPVKVAWDAMCLPFKPYQFISKTPGAISYGTKLCWQPEPERNMFVDLFGMCGLDLGCSQHLTAEEVEAEMQKAEQIKAAAEANLEKINKNLNPTK